MDFLRAEYLSDFVKSGGSAVKFAVADDGAEVRALLRNGVLAEGYAVAPVDAGDVRAHMIDKIFHEVAADRLGCGRGRLRDPRLS